MDEIKKDIKEIKEVLHSQTKELTRYNVLLDEHMKRTDILEKQLEPVRDHVKFVHMLGKLIIATVTILASAGAILSLFGK